MAKSKTKKAARSGRLAVPLPPRPADDARSQLWKMPDAELEALCRTLPKTELHCHLDGSMRIETIRDLALEPDCIAAAKTCRYKLPPTDDLETLGGLLFPGHDCDSLEAYLRAFDFTCAVLQTPEALERAAYELAMDCHAESIWYLEVRFAPMRHVNHIMDGLAVMQAVDRGLERAERETDGAIRTAIIVCAMRNFSREIGHYFRQVSDQYRYATSRELAAQTSLETARLTVKAAVSGLHRVVGFDLAGPEMNYPPKHHTHAFHEIANNLLDVTVHAGEGFGPESIKQAVTHLGAHRLGHGTRVLEDETGAILEFIRDHRIAIEACLTSNLQTKAIESLDSHPFPLLLRNEVRVALSTDNRLISGTDVSKELVLAIKSFKLTREEVRRTILYGFKAAFLPYNERRHMLLKARTRLAELGLND